MARKQGVAGLGPREQQIMDVIYRLGEASVGDVLSQIDHPPSYSAVRTMIRSLEAKGLLRHRAEGTKYLYSRTQSPDQTRKSALRHLMTTFFAGSAADAVAAILDPSVTKLTDADVLRLEALIHDARAKGK